MIYIGVSFLPDIILDKNQRNIYNRNEDIFNSILYELIMQYNKQYQLNIGYIIVNFYNNIFVYGTSTDITKTLKSLLKCVALNSHKTCPNIWNLLHKN